MNFYKDLEPFYEYLHSIRKLKTYLSFDMQFPSKWSIPKSISEDGKIVSFNSENADLKGISFVTELNEQEVGSTLSKIERIIKLNKERELKEKLFKHTIEQLKQTFEKNDLDKLQNLYFDFDNQQPNLEDNGEDKPEPAVIELAE